LENSFRGHDHEGLVIPDLGNWHSAIFDEIRPEELRAVLQEVLYLMDVASGKEVPGNYFWDDLDVLRAFLEASLGSSAYR